MRRHGLALGAGFLILGLGLTRWYGNRSGGPAQITVTSGETVQQAVSEPLPAQPPMRAQPAALRPFEPIAVLPEPFTDPRQSGFEPFLGGAEDSEYDGAARSNPRPEPVAPRMPYADEELSEFALLLHSAAELRRCTTPVLSPAPDFMSNEDAAELFPPLATPRTPRCPRNLP